jgi:DMSO/TMAO reductase YedYZ heme-binding membrane subunit
MFVTAGLHVVMLYGWSRDGLGDFFDADGFFGGDGGGTAANWVGLVALGYALALVVTSNDFSRRLLRRGWKFVQRQAYPLFVLTWLHTAGSILIDGYNGQSFIPWFWGFTLMAVLAQFAGLSTRCACPEVRRFSEHQPRTVSKSLHLPLLQSALEL